MNNFTDRIYIPLNLHFVSFYELLNLLKLSCEIFTVICTLLFCEIIRVFYLINTSHIRSMRNKYIWGLLVQRSSVVSIKNPIPPTDGRNH